MFQESGVRRFLGILAIAASLILLWSMFFRDPPAYRLGDGPFYLAVRVPGERIRVDSVAEPADDREVPSDLAAIACRVYEGWLRDEVVGLDVVIVDDPRLVRSAELLDGTYRVSESAVRAEVLHREGLSQQEILQELKDEGLGASELSEAQQYLVDVSEPPSSIAQERYGAYLVSATSSMRLLTTIDVGEVVQVANPRSRVHAIPIALPDGRVVGVSDELCVT